jgi:hypothetical protein
MTLAPICGVPPECSYPDLPVEEPRVKPADPTTTPPSGDQSAKCPIRRGHTPIEIVSDGITLTFKVISELPAIAQASITIGIVAYVGKSGFFRCQP